jgi:hypothetical protein
VVASHTSDQSACFVFPCFFDVISCCCRFMPGIGAWALYFPLFASYIRASWCLGNSRRLWSNWNSVLGRLVVDCEHWLLLFTLDNIQSAVLTSLESGLCFFDFCPRAWWPTLIVSGSFPFRRVFAMGAICSYGVSKKPGSMLQFYHHQNWTEVAFPELKRPYDFHYR